MLATHTIDPEDLYTITSGGFSATADAFARDDNTDGLWFVSMVGSQTALKAIWASLLKQPPDTAHIIRGADGMALSGGYQRCQIPYETIGTWTTKIARLPVSGGWHALVYTKPPSTDSRRAASSCWRRPRMRPPRCTTASWTSAARSPCTAPGRTGSGGGAWTTGR